MGNEVLVQALSGAIGASFATAVFYPMELVKVRVQTSRNPEVTAPKVLKGIIAEGGLLGMYENALPQIVKAALFDGSFFAWRAIFEGKIKRMIGMETTSSFSVVGTILISMLAGSVAQSHNHPISTVCTRTMTRLPVQWSARELYKGVDLSLLLTINPALQFTVFERAKKLLERFLQIKELNSGQIFLLGMVTKAITLTILYPLIRVKMLAQAGREDGKFSHAGETTEYAKKTDMLSGLKRVFAEEGVMGFYKGLSSQVSKSMLSTALLLTAKLKIEIVARRLLSKNK